MLRDFQSYDTEVLLNVYFFQDLLLASTAENLCDAWIAGFLPKVIACQTATVVHDKVDCVNLADPGNFFETPTGDAGEFAGASMPAHDAVNFSLRLNTRAIRPGSKRYAGVPEPSTDRNFINDAGYIAALEDLRIQQSAVLLSGVVATFQPVVVKRVKYNPDPGDLTKFAYRLPETEPEFLSGDIVGALVNLRVSHQVSRNNGR
jgi:hypothetical protein